MSHHKRHRARCQKCGKRKEQKYMNKWGPSVRWNDYLDCWIMLSGPIWTCKNCNDENRAYGKTHWNSSKPLTCQTT